MAVRIIDRLLNPSSLLLMFIGQSNLVSLLINQRRRDLILSSQLATRSSSARYNKSTRQSEVYMQNSSLSSSSQVFIYLFFFTLFCFFVHLLSVSCRRYNIDSLWTRQVLNILSPGELDTNTSSETTAH